MNRLMVCLAMLMLGWVAPRMAAAECRGCSGNCCACCGCECQCQKVCKLVPEVRKVPKVCYECECEDFCVPGKSCIIGYECVPRDCTCGYRLLREPIWQPSCGCVRTRHKLVKIEEMKEVKGFKCVVVKMCPHCCAMDKKGELPEATLAAAIEKSVPEDQRAGLILPGTAPEQTQIAAGEAAEPPVTQVAAEEQPASDMQLISHNAPSGKASTSLIDRMKRSILGGKSPSGPKDSN
jgi:hypothetical protein